MSKSENRNDKHVKIKDLAKFAAVEQLDAVAGVGERGARALGG